MDADQAVTAHFVDEPAPGVVTQDGAYSSAAEEDETATSITFAHTLGTGADRLTLVGISWNCGTSNTSNEHITSVIFTPDGGGEQTLSEVVTQRGGTDTYRYSAIYSLLPDAAALAGGATGTITVTFDGAVPNGIVAGAANFQNVDQTVPLGTPAGANGTGWASSVTLDGLDGVELVFANAYQGGADSSQTLTPGAGETELWERFAINACGSANIEQATGSSVTMSATGFDETDTYFWVITAVAINPSTETTLAVNLPDSAGPFAQGKHGAGRLERGQHPGRSVPHLRLRRRLLLPEQPQPPPELLPTPTTGWSPSPPALGTSSASGMWTLPATGSSTTTPSPLRDQREHGSRAHRHHPRHSRPLRPSRDGDGQLGRASNISEGYFHIYAFDGDYHYLASHEPPPEPLPTPTTGPSLSPRARGYVIRIWYVDGGGNWLLYDDSEPTFEISGSTLPAPTVTLPDSAGPFAQGSTVPVAWDVASPSSEGVVPHLRLRERHLLLPGEPRPPTARLPTPTTGPSPNRPALVMSSASGMWTNCGNWLCYDDSTPAFEISGGSVITPHRHPTRHGRPRQPGRRGPGDLERRREPTGGYYHVYAFGSDTYYYLGSEAADGLAFLHLRLD